MTKKDIDLFSKAIHNEKKIIQDIENERQRYHKKLNRCMKNIELIRNSHDKKMKDLMEEAKEVLDETYELFDNLYKGEI